MHLYIAGPMTGIPQFNYPVFEAMATLLRRDGHDVVSPAEMDDPATRAAALASPDGAPGTGSANGETWGDFLSRDVKLLADDGIEGVVVLPGWQFSRGARLETFVANAICGLPLYHRGASGLLLQVPPELAYSVWCDRGMLTLREAEHLIMASADELLTDKDNLGYSQRNIVQTRNYFRRRLADHIDDRDLFGIRGTWDD